MNFLTIIYFIAGLSILIAFHEFGHFIAAKLFNVYVYEYSLFMGPKLFQFKVGETKYTLRCLPIGGYCSMAGEEDTQSKRNENELENDKEENVDQDGDPLPDVPYERTMLGIKKWKKIVIMAAGPVFNVILALLFMFTYYLCGSSSRVTVAEGSKIAEAGMKSDENIEKFSFSFYEGTMYEAEEDAKNHVQGVVTSTEEVDSFFTVENIYDEGFNYINDRLLAVYEDVTTAPASIDYELKFTTDKGTYTIKDVFEIKFAEDNKSLDLSSKISLSELGITSAGGYKLGKSISKTFTKVGEFSVLIFKSLGKLFTKDGLNNMSGVVGMYRVSKTFMNYGFWYFVYFLGLISVNLGIMNALPFPALDGGRIVLTIIEAITHKKASAKVEGILNGAGFIILIGLMVFVTIKDIFFPVI